MSSQMHIEHTIQLTIFFVFLIILVLLCAAVDLFCAPQHSPTTHGARVVETNDAVIG